MTLFDSHCHINFPVFDQDRNQILALCKSKGISHLCIPATRASEWPDLLHRVQNKAGSIVRQFAALGLHPCFQNEHSLEQLDHLDQLLANKPEGIIAVGETGLDFFNAERCNDDRAFQIALFSKQVELAKKHQLPVIIHARKSHDSVLKILRQKTPDRAGIIHAFSGSEQQAYQYIELGFKLGFGGGITYERARKTRQLARSLSLSSIVLETDAPDMPLSGFQGQRNSPERLPDIARCLAELRNQPLQIITKETSNNCIRLFHLPSDDK